MKTRQLKIVGFKQEESPIISEEKKIILEQMDGEVNVKIKHLSGTLAFDGARKRIYGFVAIVNHIAKYGYKNKPEWLENRKKREDWLYQKKSELSDEQYQKIVEDFLSKYPIFNGISDVGRKYALDCFIKEKYCNIAEIELKENK